MAASHRSLPLSFVAVALLAAITGCGDDTTVARQIQSQQQRSSQSKSTQDHLGEVFNLLGRLVDLNAEKARRQISYHLNRWSDTRGEKIQPSSPELIRTLTDVLPSKVASERIERDKFVPSDVSHLRDSFLFHQIVAWVDGERGDDPLLADWLTEQEGKLGEDEVAKLRTATRLFDWTVRNIALEPLVVADPSTPLPVPLPLGMKFAGAGYRQTDYQAIWRGTGDALQRGGVFIQLCRQAAIPAFVLSVPEDSGQLTPWCVGVMIGEEIYLFEPQLGTFIPGPDQVGIATLAQARSDSSVLRRLNVPGFFDYTHSKTDVQQCIALLNVIPEAVSPRMKKLESGLTGDRRMIVYVDVDAQAERIDQVSGIAGVRLWSVPILAEAYQFTMIKGIERDPMFAVWYSTRWAIDAPVGVASHLSRARWRHLQGDFDDDEEENEKGARTLYLELRAPEFEIEKLDIDVELQKLYNIRRELGTERQDYERQIQQAQFLMRQGKRTATYWLSLIQYDDMRYDTAEKWFVKRALDEKQASSWFPAARYNLARTAERLGQADRAIELYKTNGDPQEHGNRIRARLVAKTQS